MAISSSMRGQASKTSRKALEDDLVEMGEAEDVDTLGGLVAAFLGRVPARGEIVAANERFEIEVIDADPRRIKKLRIHRKLAQDERALAKPGGTSDKSEA
jgi:CBS domain containing-hemolysin-like protein